MSDQIHHSLDRLHEAIKDIRFAMLTTRAPDGTLRARPMTTQAPRMGPPDADKLWFFASRSGEPVAELLQDPTVNVSYADTDDDVYISVAGTASLVEDHAARERLWSDLVEAWFPQGIDDPDLTLICVQIGSAEYWNVTEGKLTQLAKMAKAAFTGEPPREMGEHGKIG